MSRRVTSSRAVSTRVPRSLALDWSWSMCQTRVMTRVASSQSRTRSSCECWSKASGLSSARVMTPRTEPRSIIGAASSLRMPPGPGEKRGSLSTSGTRRGFPCRATHPARPSARPGWSCRPRPSPRVVSTSSVPVSGLMSARLARFAGTALRITSRMRSSRASEFSTVPGRRLMA